MEEVEFNPVALRKSVAPAISRAEMARRLGVSYSFLYFMERGDMPWPPKRVEQFKGIVAAWRDAPPPDPKKRRSDFGRKHRKRKRKKIAAAIPKAEPIPVPHSHGEIVGIG